MDDKAKELFAAFKAGKMSRRELMSGAAKLGVSAATANFLFNAAATQALAADFDWKKFQGTKLHLLLNKHPYADAMIADLDNFKGLTGMDVTYDIFPEDVYFDKVTAALSSKSSQYDAFMTGAYMTWTYGPAGWIEDLNTWIKDPAKTNPKYDWEDVQPGLRASTAWNGVPLPRSDRPTPSNGAYRGASSSTRPRITARCTTRPWSEAREASSGTHRDHRQAHQGSGWTIRHRRPRLTLVGDNPSGVPVRLFQLRAARLYRHRR